VLTEIMNWDVEGVTAAQRSLAKGDEVTVAARINCEAMMISMVQYPKSPRE
jgi:hypothetical protein